MNVNIYTNFQSMPDIQLDRKLLAMLSNHMDKETIGLFVLSLIDYFNGFDDEAQIPEEFINDYRILKQASLQRANAWLNRTKNFRTNNPKKNEKENQA